MKEEFNKDMGERIKQIWEIKSSLNQIKIQFKATPEDWNKRKTEF
jgi:hypothetical protein